MILMYYISQQYMCDGIFLSVDYSVSSSPFQQIINYPPLHPLSNREKHLVWMYRYYLSQDGRVSGGHTALYQSALHQSALYHSTLYQSGLYQSGLYQSALYQSGLYQSALNQSALCQSALYHSTLCQSALYHSTLCQLALSLMKHSSQSQLG